MTLLPPAAYRRLRRTIRRPLAAAVASVVVLSGCVDDGVPDLDGPAVAARFDEVVDATDPDGPPSSDCPIGGVGDLLDSTFDLVDDAAVVSALGGSEVGGVVDVGDGRVLVCGLQAEGDLVAFVVTAPPPAEVSRPTLDPGDDVRVEARPTTRYRGGLMAEVCASAASDPGSGDARSDGVTVGGPADSCEVVWTDEDALVGVLVRGDGADRVLTTLVQERFRLTLPIVVERFLDD